MGIPIPNLKKQPMTDAQRAFIEGGSSSFQRAPEAQAPQQAAPVVQPIEASKKSSKRNSKEASVDSKLAGKRGDRSAFKRLSVELSPEMHRRLRIAAINQETTMSALVLALLKEKGF